MRRATAVVVAGVIVAVLGCAGDYATAQAPVQTSLASDSRNRGIDVWVHRDPLHWSRLVVDIQSVRADKAPLDVMRALFQTAAALKDREYDVVVLSSKGNGKFLLQGSYFHIMGRDYGTENPVYAIRTLPENLYDLSGKQAFGTWSGGILGVVGKQMEDVTEFNRRWYGDAVVP